LWLDLGEEHKSWNLESNRTTDWLHLLLHLAGVLLAAETVAEAVHLVEEAAVELACLLEVLRHKQEVAAGTQTVLVVELQTYQEEEVDELQEEEVDEIPIAEEEDRQDSFDSFL